MFRPEWVVLGRLCYHGLRVRNLKRNSSPPDFGKRDKQPDQDKDDDTDLDGQTGRRTNANGTQTYRQVRKTTKTRRQCQRQACIWIGKGNDKHTHRQMDKQVGRQVPEYVVAHGLYHWSADLYSSEIVSIALSRHDTELNGILRPGV